jgi:DNA polymerase III epsilon subunit-like protein
MDGDGGPSRQDRRKAKKLAKKAAAGRLSETALAAISDPGLVAAIYEGARVGVERVVGGRITPHHSVHSQDLRQLLLSLFEAAPTPPWVTVCNRAVVSSVVVLLARGGLLCDWVQHRASGAAGSSVLRDALHFPLRAPRRRYNSVSKEIGFAEDVLLYEALESGSGRAAGKWLAGREPRSLIDAWDAACGLALNAEELEANGFPVLSRALHGSGADAGEWATDAAESASTGHADWSVPAGHVATRTALRDWRGLLGGHTGPIEPPSPLRLVALDCEMCQTAAGHQLARVTLVDDSDAVLLDAVVKPVLPITDYLTQFSGMTPALIAGATHSFEEAQEAVRAILDGDGLPASAAGPPAAPAFVVGHSVDGDLRSLRLVHSRVLDTSIAYLHPAGLPIRHALRHLVRTHLDREIQTGRGVPGAGHCSAEDATAALHLIKRMLLGHPAADVAGLHAKWEAAVSVTPAQASAAGGAGRDDEDAGEVVDAAEAAAPPPAKRAAHEADGGVAPRPPPLPTGAHVHPHPHPFPCHFASAGSQERMPPLDHEAAAADGVVPRLSMDRAREREGLTGGPRGAAGAMSALRAAVRGGSGDTEPSGDGGSGGSGGGGGAAVGSKRGRDDAGGSARATAPRAPPAPKAPSLFARTMFSGRDRSVCPGVSLIGTSDFTRRHSAGSCSTILAPVAPTVASWSSVLEKALAEAKRMHMSRKPGQVRYVGIVVAQGELPRALAPSAAAAGGHPAPDWAATDAVLAKFTASAPPGTLVLMLTEAATGGSAVAEVGGARALAGRKSVADAALATCEPGERTMLSADEPAAWGNVFLWPPMRAQPAVAVAGGAGGGGSGGGSSDSE